MGPHNDTAWKQTVYTKIGAEVRRRRGAANLSGRQVAERLGIAANSVIMYESGGTSIPLHFLIAFSQLIGCTMQELCMVDVAFPFAREKAA